MYIILFIIEEASSDPNIHMQETTTWYPRSRIFKLSLGATVKAQVVGKEGSYYIVIEDT